MKQNNETCKHGGTSPKDVQKFLHKSQGGTGRHKCPYCAYEQGYVLGSSMNWANYTEYCSSLSCFEIEECRNGTKVPTTILEKLGENQGGTGRHKCTNCAFKKGFEYGLFGSTKTEIQLQSFSNIDLEPVPVPKGINLKTKNINSSEKTNFLEKEIKNRKLGLLGELFILHYEKEKLIKAGLGKFAKNVVHISQTKGDGQGYDILSFNKDGQKKMIEVKTTRSGINRPFYITKNELETSTKNSTDYYLYRLFDFDPNQSKGKYYFIKGNLNDLLRLEPTIYISCPN